MSSERLKDAAAIPAPIADDGDVLVFASATSASAAIDVFQKTGGPAEFWRLFADGVNFFLTFGRSDLTDPNATATSGGGRSIKLEAGQSIPYEFDGERRFMKHLASDTNGFLRMSKESRRG